MQPVRINEAEAFIEPFFEAGASRLHETYTGRWHGSATGRVRGGFAAVEIDISPGEPGAVAFSMEKRCDLDLGEYDELRMLLALPSWASVVVELQESGGAGGAGGTWRKVIDSQGRGTTEEYAGELPFARVSGVRFSFSVAKKTDITAAIRWLGVANRKRVQQMLSRPSPFPPDWPLMLEPAGKRPSFEPSIGIYFGGGDELEALRARTRRSPHREGFAKMAARAREHLEDRPEASIGKLVPKPDRRFCRDRDMERSTWAHLMEDLAFVGIVERDEALCRMAARMALSAAHCEHWFESDVGVHPGKLWHHRSFTEEVYSRSCALVLDWAGFCLTSYGRAVVLNAIATKGLPRIEQDFMESEYIRHMNQGIVFSSGRIHGLVALAKIHPRYAARVAEAEKDILEIIDDYVKEDGGTLEGPGYWHYTFMNAIATVYVLARYRNLSLDRYATDALVRTGAFELGMLSTVGGGHYLLPINDCHRSPVHPDLAAAYAAMTGSEKWRKIHAMAAGSADSSPGYFSFIIAPDEVLACESAVEPGFRFYPTVGQVDWVTQDPGLGPVHFHFVAGPAYSGHYNCDKGSFIIEAGEDILAMDRGVTNYSHPETNLLKRSGRHNLLQPEPEGVPTPDQLSTCNPGALVTQARGDGRGMMLTCDVSGAWPEGLFTGNRRSVLAEGPRSYRFEDHAECVQAMALSFRLNSTFPMVVERAAGAGVSVRIIGKGADLLVTPEGWTPAEVTTDEEGIDGEQRPVNLLRLVSAKAREHRLTTRIEVMAK